MTYTPNSQQPLLVFGGIYSNLEALQALYAAAQQLGFSPKQIICTGDILGYCADPETCVQFVKDWGIQVISGNVELNIVEGSDDCGCNFDAGSRCEVFSRTWFPYAKERISSSSLAWLAKLPTQLSFVFGGKKVQVVHGSYHNCNEFIFASTPWKVKMKNFLDSKADVILAGHSGLPFIEENEGKTWFNPGVIGMPANDGTPRVWYGLISMQEQDITYQIRALNYNFQKASKKMQASRLPNSYAKTLATGIWDNCEILPTTETNLQGLAIREYTSITKQFS